MINRTIKSNIALRLDNDLLFYIKQMSEHKNLSAMLKSLDKYNRFKIEGVKDFIVNQVGLNPKASVENRIADTRTSF